MVQSELESKGVVGIKQDMLVYTLERLAAVQEQVSALLNAKVRHCTYCIKCMWMTMMIILRETEGYFEKHFSIA